MPVSEVSDLILFGLQVRDFNIAKSDKDIGFYAGYLGELIKLSKG
jgi:hypothetical protein